MKLINYLIIMSVLPMTCNLMAGEINTPSFFTQKKLNGSEETNNKPLVNKIIDLNKIIEQYQKYSIKGVLKKEMSAIYYQPDKEESFIRYFLIADSIIHNMPAGDILGTLVIYEVKKSNHNFFDFIEISTDVPGLPIYNNIEVGTSLSSLKHKLGEPYTVIENIYIYRDDDTLIISLFKIEDNKIKWYKAGRYNKEILADINSNIQVLLNHHP